MHASSATLAQDSSASALFAQTLPADFDDGELTECDFRLRNCMGSSLNLGSGLGSFLLGCRTTLAT